MNFLQKVRESIEDKTGTCETCGNLDRISESLIGCIVHDKLILPDYPPYRGNMNCPDWKKRDGD